MRASATVGEGTTITVRSACWKTAWETLPINSDFGPVSPGNHRGRRASIWSASAEKAAEIVVCSAWVRGCA